MSEDPYNKKGDEANTASTAEIIAQSDTVVGGESGYFQIKVDIGDADVETSSGSNADADVTIQLYVAGQNEESVVASTNATESENETVNVRLTNTFKKNSAVDDSVDDEVDVAFNSYPRTVEPIWAKAEIVYRDPQTDEELFRTTTSTGKTDIAVTDPLEEFERRGFQELEGERLGSNPLSDTFSGRTPFAIKRISYEDDASYISSIYVDDERNDDGEYQISFKYPNPTLAIDTSGRFAKHEIIGGSTVRQKIGEDPVNVSINGVCNRRTANQIDSLRDAKSGKIFSDRLPGSNDALRVQFGSTSTEPMEDGGSADLKDGQYLYSYQINCIEVIR